MRRKTVNEAIMEKPANVAKSLTTATSPPVKYSPPVNNGASKSSSFQNKQYMISSLCAGIGSGTIASVVCAPLDLVRTRMQVMGSLTSHEIEANASKVSKIKAIKSNIQMVQTFKEIIAADGFVGCFRGLGATLATVPLFWGLYFPLYQYMKDEIAKVAIGNDSIMKDQGGALIHMSSAILAGGVVDFVCNPMFVVRTRMQTEALHTSSQLSITGTFKNLYQEGGIPIFWRGLTASLLGLSHVAIQFPVYERLKIEARKRSPDNKERPIDLIFASGMSKLCASSITYPHEVIRSRMMDSRGTTTKSLMELCSHIVKTEGISGMYRGLHVTLARVVPNCCVTFVCYEMLLRWSQDYLNDKGR